MQEGIDLAGSPASSKSKDSTLGRPDFLYSAEAQKLHKRKRSRWQLRRLKFFSDRVDYHKVGSDKRCGSFLVKGVRAEVELAAGVDMNTMLLEFEYDDMVARKYVFRCDNPLVAAQMLWVTNGEQFNHNGQTYKMLRPETIQFMSKKLSHPILRELVNQKYQRALSFFTMGACPGLNKRVYEDPGSLGNRIPTDVSSSSDSETYELDNVHTELNSLSNVRSIRRIGLSKENSFDASTEKSSSVGSGLDEPMRQPASGKMPKHIALAAVSAAVDDDPGYITIADSNYIDFGFNMEKDHGLLRTNHSTTIASRSQQKSVKRSATVPSCLELDMKSRAAPITTTVQLCSEYKHLDVGALQVNAIKARLTGDRDFIEIDVEDLGKDLKSLHTVLCAEFDISPDDIGCIVKLPDVRIRNDKDVQRIRSGRMLEIETCDH